MKIENDRKEKIKDLIFYICLAIFALIVWYASYDLGVEYFRGEVIPIGQEYHIKDINMGNSSLIIIYYDNDKNNTERMLIPTNYNNISFIQYNSTLAILKLEKIENGINYWNIYMPEDRKIQGE